MAINNLHFNLFIKILPITFHRVTSPTIQECKQGNDCENEGMVVIRKTKFYQCEQEQRQFIYYIPRDENREIEWLVTYLGVFTDSTWRVVSTCRVVMMRGGRWRQVLWYSVWYRRGSKRVYSTARITSSINEWLCQNKLQPHIEWMDLNYLLKAVRKYRDRHDIG